MKANGMVFQRPSPVAACPTNHNISDSEMPSPKTSGEHSRFVREVELPFDRGLLAAYKPGDCLLKLRCPFTC
jgi:hypothetical protein